jgi:hypothetical protein
MARVSVNYSKTTTVFLDKLYPIVAKKLETRTPKVKAMVAEFINKDHNGIYDIAPYNNIYYRESDKEAFFKAFDLTEKEVNDIMQDCFYWNKPYNPGCAKEPYVQVAIAAIRYYLKNKKRKEAEIVTIYLAFSGKFYASLYTSSAVFPSVNPGKYKSVMDYVINSALSGKFDLKKYGNMFVAIRSLCITWLDTYGDELVQDIDDDRVGKLLQQLREREKSFLHNIAVMFYKAWENRNFLNYESDNMNVEEFRLTDNDSVRANRLTEISVNYLLHNNISMAICNKCKDSNVKATEVLNIMETIVGDKANIPNIYRVVSIIICDFIRNYSNERVGSPAFYAHSLKAKPNVKDEYLVDLRRIIISWLDENSPAYRKRKSRIATANSYYKAILAYFVISIGKATEKQ